MNASTNNVPIFIQYAFWPNCNNGCRFCLHRGKRMHSTIEMARDIDVLHQTLKDDFARFDGKLDISFIGGEFFDDQLDNKEVREKFYEMTSTCSSFFLAGNLKRFMVCSSLIFDINHSLKSYIEFLRNEGSISSFMLCTSYDTCYRFRSVFNENLWKNNMLSLKEAGVNVHTEIILTQDFIDKVLSDQFDILSFQTQFSTIIDFIEPTFIGSMTKQQALNQLPKFFPTRKSFLEFIKKVCFKDKTMSIDSILDLKLRSRYVRFVNSNGILTEIDDRWKNDCRRYDDEGNSVSIYTYSDSDKSMIDDLKVLKNGGI